MTRTGCDRRIAPASWLAALTLVAAPLLLGAQQQAPTRRAGWPCGARLDPSYFQIAEGSGGHLLLLAPEEIGDSAALLTAFDEHRQTIFRLAGSITPGLHEFRVPVESSVDSVLFSTSVQCLQASQVLRPSGAPVVPGDEVTDYSNFRGEHMVIVRRPEPGVWTIRVGGSGVAAVVVQARSTIAITQLSFAPVPNRTFTPIPKLGVENAVRIQISGPAADIRASLVSGVLQRVAALGLASGETDGSYVARLTPPPDSFRLLITGTDAQGLAFQRMHAPLLTPQP